MRVCSTNECERTTNYENNNESSINCRSAEQPRRFVFVLRSVRPLGPTAQRNCFLQNNEFFVWHIAENNKNKINV